MAKALTDKSVKALGPAAARIEVADGGKPGLRIVIQPTGAKSWVFRYSHQTERNKSGKPRSCKLTLGGYPKLGLKEARKLATDAAEKVSVGRDPAAEKAAAKRMDPAGDRDTFATVAEEFLTRHVHRNTRPSSAAETERILRKDVLPKWGRRRIHDITKRDILDLLDSIVDAGRGLIANRTLAVVRKLFNWAVERDIIAASPCTGVKAPLAERSQDRILTDDEIRCLWKATTETGYPFGDMTRMLLLTGQRRNEVAGLTMDEVDAVKALWTIPGARTKNGEPHDVPLSAAAMGLLDARPKIVSTRKGPAYAFTTDGAVAVSGFSRAKSRLDRIMNRIASEEAGEPITIPDWRLHDLRRTLATGMQRLGIGLQVVEAVLNHVSGSRAGIVGVYQRYEYTDEKRNALEAWARNVQSITEGVPSNVVRLGRA